MGGSEAGPASGLDPELQPSDLGFLPAEFQAKTILTTTDDLTLNFIKKVILLSWYS